MYIQYKFVRYKVRCTNRIGCSLIMVFLVQLAVLLHGPDESADGTSFEEPHYTVDGQRVGKQLALPQTKSDDCDVMKLNEKEGYSCGLE